MKWSRDQYTVTDDPAAMDIPMIHGFLTQSYWAKGIDRATVERSVANSLSMGVFSKGAQIGFGRAVTDRATFAYLADVFILPEYRGRGLGQWLIDCFLHHPELQGLRRWLLGTVDAHGLYARKGFVPLQEPARFMEITRKRPYEITLPTGPEDER